VAPGPQRPSGIRIAGGAQPAGPATIPRSGRTRWLRPLDGRLGRGHTGERCAGPVPDLPRDG
jgi:hypothetical protein